MNVRESNALASLAEPRQTGVDRSPVRELVSSAECSGPLSDSRADAPERPVRSDIRASSLAALARIADKLGAPAPDGRLGRAEEHKVAQDGWRR